jgi:bacterioferritin-associated ferredoxin
LKLTSVFIIMGSVEGSVSFADRPWAPAMTRCECTGLRFDEVARRLREDGQTLEQVQETTGCGRLCSACLPELEDHLAARR